MNLDRYVEPTQLARLNIAENAINPLKHLALSCLSADKEFHSGEIRILFKKIWGLEIADNHLANTMKSLVKEGRAIRNSAPPKKGAPSLYRITEIGSRELENSIAAHLSIACAKRAVCNYVNGGKTETSSNFEGDSNVSVLYNHKDGNQKFGAL